MSSNDNPLYEPGLQTNQRTVRPGIWLLAAGTILLLCLAAFGLSFIEPAAPEEMAAIQPTAVPTTIVEPVGAGGTAVNEPVNPTLEPIQTLLTNQQPIMLQENGVTWQMNPRAQFTIAARIVGRQVYRDDWMAPFMPVDLLVAWGELSNPEVDQWISWGQSGRVGWVSQPREGPFTVNDTISQFANIHIIPATENLETAVKRLGRDDIVLLEGLLVDIESNKGTTTTSLSRTDSGAGGCEILYIRRLVVDGVEYR